MVFYPPRVETSTLCITGKLQGHYEDHSRDSLGSWLVETNHWSHVLGLPPHRLPSVSFLSYSQVFSNKDKNQAGNRVLNS